MLKLRYTKAERKSIRRDWKRRFLNRKYQNTPMTWEGVVQVHTGIVQFVTYSPYGEPDTFYAYVVAGNPQAPVAADYVRLG